jgi:hypothetical protein
VLRTGLIVLGCIVAVAIIATQLFPSDRKRVEEKVEQLAELARRGGPEAAEEILDALADDYRGSVSRKEVDRYVRRYIGGGKVRSLTLGNFKTLWKGDEILVPILAVRADVGGYAARLVLTVTFGNRDGVWRITSISRTRFGSG